MIFLNKLQKLLNEYENSSCDIRDNAFLYGICNPAPPVAMHIVFAPMPEKIKNNLIDDYKRTIPPELLTLYSVMNGADLFWTVYTIGKKTRIPISRLSIYGVPLTCDRKHLEPFNICIEDLNRHDNIPSSWLKFGSYYSPEGTNDRLDLFVDTETLAVFAVKNGRDEYCVHRTWTSIDYCLCCLFETFCRDK